MNIVRIVRIVRLVRLVRIVHGLRVALIVLTALVQADGRFDLERQNVGDGDDEDLFGGGPGEVDNFGPDTKPNSNWWDGTLSKLRVDQISPTAETMTFSTSI